MAQEMLLSFSLSACLCVGLSSVVWAIYSLMQYQDAGNTVSAFAVTLIFSHMLELFISPFVSTRLLEGNNCNYYSPCWVLYSALSVARLCGLHFHQLVALEGFLSLVYSKTVRFLWSSVLSVTVWIVVIASHFFPSGYTINLIFCMVPVFLAIVTNCFFLRLALLSNCSVRHRHLGLLFSAVSLLIFAVLYMPCLVLILVAYPDPFYDIPWSTIPVSIMSLRVVIEPLWCVLLLREIQKCKASLHLGGTKV